MNWFTTLAVLIPSTLIFAIPLMVVALGGMFSERSGVTNIALEGIMIMGGFTSISFIHVMQQNSTLNGQPLLLLACLVAMLTGAVFSLFHAYAAINLRADQTISGTALNMFAPAFTIFVARMVQGVQQVDFDGKPFMLSITLTPDTPVIGRWVTNSLNLNTYITTLLGFVILALAWVVLYKTKFGLRLRACGEHPQAADSVGVNVYRMRYTGVLISGALGGLGGLIFVVTTSVNFQSSVSGYGFLAIAVLIFGQWKPVRIMLASLFFGVMKAISTGYSAIPLLAALDIKSDIYKMIPYIATLIVLAFSSKNSQAPRANGVPYDKGLR